MIETDVATITEMLKGFALGFGLDLLGAVLILVIGWWIAGRTAALVRHSLKCKIRRLDSETVGSKHCALCRTDLCHHRRALELRR